MAPKKGAPATTEEIEGPAVHIAVEILEGFDLFECGGAPNEGQDSAPPELFATFSVLGEHGDSRDSPVGTADASKYAFHLHQTFKRPLTEDTAMRLMSEVLNTELKITVHRSDTGMAAATGVMDITSFVDGLHTVENREVKLERVSAPVDGEPYHVTERGRLWARVSLQQDEEVPGGDGEGEPAEDGTRRQKPFTLVSPADAEKSCVVELTLSGAAPVPDALESVVSSVPDRGLNFSCGLAIPGVGGCGPRGIIIAGGQLSDGRVEWAGSRRFYLSPTVVKAFKEAVEDGQKLTFEIARYLAPDVDGFKETAFENYHGVALVDIAEELTVPGSISASTEASSFSSPSSSDDAHQILIMTPPEPPANPKAKPLETPPESSDGSPCSCAWGEAGTTVQFKLTLSRPLVPPWKPPPKPSKSLSEIVPKRPEKKPEPPKTADQEFRQQIADVTQFLLKEFNNIDCENEPNEKKRQVVFELNRSGKYLDIKEQLKKYVIKIVKEKYRKKGEMTKEDMVGLYNDLYVHLMDIAHNAMKPADPSAPQAPLPTEDDLSHLLDLARQYELGGNIPAAEKKHLERLSVGENAQVLYDFGCFSSRRGDLGKAEECFREALSLKNDDIPSLLALSAVLCHNGIFTDPSFTEEAEVFAHAAKDLEPENALIWALLAVIMTGVHSKNDVRNVVHETNRLCKAASENGFPALEVNAYLPLAMLLLDLHLPEIADKALTYAIGMKETEEALAMETALCQARSAHLQGNDDVACSALKKASRSAADGDIRSHVLLGNIHSKAGKLQDAANSYQHCIHSNLPNCPLEVFVNLGAFFISTSEWESANNVYLQGCVHHPCAILWLGAGISYLRLEEFQNSELALCEANILDNRNPLVWGNLALLSLKRGRDAEATKAFDRAMEDGIEDVSLLTEIGDFYTDAGRYREAEEVFRRLLRLSDNCETHERLGGSLVEQNRHGEAKKCFDRALALGGNECDRIRLVEKSIEVNRILGNDDEVARLENELPRASPAEEEDVCLDESA